MKKQMDSNRKMLRQDMDEDIYPDGLDVLSRVKVKAPKQKDGKSVYYSVGKHVDLNDLPDPDNFKPRRFIANIILDKDAVIDPPVNLSIEITQEDVDRALGQKFRLAYHQGQKWVVWGQEFDCQVGWVQVPLAKLGDPAIGMSP